MSSIRYVDADVLTGLANQTARTRNDLQEALLLAVGRVDHAPQRGWDYGAWWDARSTLQAELARLDDDRSSLLSRADRVRIAAAIRALLAWIETNIIHPGYQHAGNVFSKSVAGLIGAGFAPIGIAALGGLLGVAAAGWVLGGISLSPVVAEKLINVIGWLSSGVGLAIKASPPFAVITIVATTWARNAVNPEYTFGEAVAATLVDSAITLTITVALAAVIVGGIYLGAKLFGAPLLLMAAVGAVNSTPLVKALLSLAGGLSYQKFVKPWISKTGAYKTFVKKVGAVVDDAVSFAGDAVEKAGDVAGDVIAGAQTVATNAGKKIDEALDSAAQSVAEPINKVSSLFGSIDPMKKLKQGLSW